jgi:hypothetical protein
MREEYGRAGHRSFATAQACPSPSSVRNAMLLAAALLTQLLTFSSARGEAPAGTVGYQPMVSTGLAAQHPFEAWFVFDKASDPTVPGYAVPAGATIRFTLPGEFTPKPGPLGAVMLTGWSQGSIPVKFTTVMDSEDPHTIVVHLDEAIAAGPQERPGLKAIHLRTSAVNPKAGDYPIILQFVDAGALSGKTKTVAHITPNPVPNIAAYNQLHQSKDEDWQRVKTGAEAPLPIDFLVTLPDEARSSIALKAAADGSVGILSDGKSIGTITTAGVPITLTPQAFGPGYARLGIIEVRAKAGATPGTAQIVAALDGGTEYVINLIVE